MSKIFDISIYGFTNVTDFVQQYCKKKNVKCQNHEDRHPSAQVNETNVYCHVCGEAFFYNDSQNSYDKNISKNIETISLMLDTDDAGKEATLKNIAVLLENSLCKRSPKRKRFLSHNLGVL